MLRIFGGGAVLGDGRTASGATVSRIDNALAPMAITLEPGGDQADESWARRSGIAEPVGRRQPDERENRDHPQIVRQRGALVGPEKRAIEGAHGAVARRQRQPVEREIRVV